jgi:hypothetical protein
MGQDKTDKTDESPAATRGTQRADELGIPDWRDVSAYGDTKKWTFWRWRWEFSRRRDDLRYAFKANAEMGYDQWLRFFNSDSGSIKRAWWLIEAQKLGVSEPPKPSEPGFTIRVEEEVGRFFGYAAIPNPRISEQPEYTITPIQDDGTVKYYESNTAEIIYQTFEKYGLNLPYKDMHMVKDILFSMPVSVCKKNEVVIVFDLDRPLLPQIEVAKKNLQRIQEGYHGKPLQKRRHPARWLGYLRVLDARDVGATWAEITHAFFEEGLIDRRKDPSGGYRDPDPQAARDMWQAADALRVNF